ncbi:MAG TPA: hypothetical protein VF386_14115 [Usitatibacter sp.]
MKRVLFAVATAAIVAGCATQDANQAEGGYVEKEYRVGSNLPSRHTSTAEGVTTISAEDLERARNSSLNPGAAMPPPRGGGH